MESTLRPVVWLMSGRVLGQAAAFLIPVVLVRLFDADTFGSYKRLFLLYGTLFGIVQLGLSESLYYFLPRHPGTGGRLISNAMAGLGAAGLFCLALLFALRVQVATLLGDAGLAPLVPWIGLFLLPMLVSSVLEIAMVSTKATGEAALTYLASDLLRAGLMVLPALAFVSLRGLLAGTVAFAALRLALSLFYVARRMGGLRLDLPLFKQQLAYALPFALAVGVETLQGNYHQYVVSSRCDAATFAVFSVALLQIPLVDQTATTASSVTMVLMGEALHRGRPQEVRALWHDTVHKLAVVFFPLVVLLVVTGPEVITVLFTTRYAEAIPLFRLASLGILLSVLQTDSVLRVLAETRVLLALNLLRLVLVAALVGPALGRYGLAGAVLATLAANLLSRAAAILRIGKLLGLGAAALLPWRRLSIAALAAAGAGLLAAGAEAAIATSWPALARLLAVSLAFAVSYALLARHLGLIPPVAPGGWLAWLKGTPAAVRSVR